jgi:hypothetical protein
MGDIIHGDHPMAKKDSTSDANIQARRRFLKNAGKFAVATPPAVTALLASARGNYAMAVSGGGHGGGGGGGGRQGNNGFGNGGGDGVPGRSGKSDRNR